MLNGDVLTDIDLTAQIAQHESTGATGTLALVPVTDPSAYGLVRLNDDASVKEFLEKPPADQIDTNLISAGAYVLERGVLDLVPAGKPVSIEREVWPRLVGNGLFGFTADALLARHRHPGALSPGHVRHHRGQRGDSGGRATGERLPRGVRGRRESTVASCRPPSSSAACASPQARTSGASSCWATGSASGAAARWSAASCCRAPRSGSTACCATASSDPASASETARRSRTVPCWERASRSAPRTSSRAELACSRGWNCQMAHSGSDVEEALRLDRAPSRRSTHPTCSPTCSRSPSTCATPSGRWSPRGWRSGTRPAAWWSRAWAAPHRRRARQGGARRPGLAPDLHRARLRPAGLDAARHHRALRVVLGQHRGDARLLRGGGDARRPPHRRDERRRARAHGAQGRRPGDPGGGRPAAARRGRLHDHRGPRGRVAVRGGTADDDGGRRRGRAPRGARDGVGARRLRRVGGQGPRARAARSDPGRRPARA